MQQAINPSTVIDFPWQAGRLVPNHNFDPGMFVVHPLQLGYLAFGALMDLTNWLSKQIFVQSGMFD